MRRMNSIKAEAERGRAHLLPLLGAPDLQSLTIRNAVGVTSSQLAAVLVVASIIHITDFACPSRDGRDIAVIVGADKLLPIVEAIKDATSVSDTDAIEYLALVSLLTNATTAIHVIRNSRPINEWLAYSVQECKTSVKTSHRRAGKPNQTIAIA